MTSEQRREAFEAEMASKRDEMEILCEMDTEIAIIIDDLTRKIESAMTIYKENGVEEEQATDRNGNLLFAIDNEFWTRKTQEQIDELDEEEKAKYTPYHKTTYEDVKIENVNELDDYERRCVIAKQRVIEKLKGLKY